MFTSEQNSNLKSLKIVQIETGGNGDYKTANIIFDVSDFSHSVLPALSESQKCSFEPEPTHPEVLKCVYQADESVPDSTIPGTIRMLLYKSPDLHCSPSQAVSDGKPSETCGI